VTLEGQLMLVNQALRDLTGHGDVELLFQEPAHLAVPEDAERCLEEMRSALAGEGDGYRLEQRWLNARGHQLWVAVSSALVRDEAGRPLYFIWHVEDVSDRRIALDRLQHLADHDALTGLVNRRRFQGELEQQIGRARRYGERATVLIVDLDDFKAVNDAHGHQAGDTVLCAVADVLRERVRDTDVVSRIGGDEFAVLLLHVDEGRAQRMAAEIESTLSTSRVPIGDTAVAISATVGTASLETGSAEVDDLLAVADAEMFRRKKTRGSEDGGPPEGDEAPTPGKGSGASGG
jgi:diguanylate cyclase (GGDEF)-like protein/PAS domain S-box-containing protein